MCLEINNSNHETNIDARLVFYDPASEDYLHNGIKVNKMKTPNVVLGLKDEFQTWTNKKAVFIDAAPGQGKSTFVNEFLFPYIKDAGGKLLIVANRVALETQYKWQLLKLTNSPALEEMKPLGIQRKNEFDGLPVVFSTYQGLRSLLNSGECSKFTHVVFDECHWFCADGLFAEDTGWLLKQIPKAFQGAVRIFMTATPRAVRNLIAEVEAEQSAPLYDQMVNAFGGPTLSPGELLYCPPVFSFPPVTINGMIQEKEISLKYYQFLVPKKNYRFYALPAEIRDNPDKGVLIDLVKKSPVDEKWVIFVDSKKQGTALAEMLNGNYLDAERKTGVVWEQLTTESSFPGRILITTPVADSGVNIIDDAVKDIVVFSTEHTQFIQELGRKRLREGEEINVYVPDLSLRQLNWRISRNNELLRVLERFNNEPDKHHLLRLDLWHSDNKELKELIPIDGSGKLHINRCAEQNVRQRDIMYRELKNRLEDGHKHPFLELVCRWLNLPDTDPERLFCHSGQEEMLRFLEKYCGRHLERKKKQDDFGGEFRRLREEIYGKRPKGNQSKERSWGADIIAGELESLKLPYKLIVNKKVWLLEKIEEVG